MKTESQNRYLIQISFSELRLMWNGWDIEQPIPTLKEANSYKSIIDDTVYKAHIVDTITKKVVENWK